MRNDKNVLLEKIRRSNYNMIGIAGGEMMQDAVAAGHRNHHLNVVGVGHP